MSCKQQVCGILICMKEVKESKPLVTEEAPNKEEVLNSTPTKEVEAKESTQTKVDDSVSKELEELRKFKAEVEAQRKLEATKPKEVKVSETFFGKKENIAKQPYKSNIEKEWEKLFEQGVPRRYEE